MALNRLGLAIGTNVGIGISQAQSQSGLADGMCMA